MNKNKWFQNIEKRLPWSFISVLLAIPLGAIAVATFLIEKKPEVEYQILNAANVLDLHKPLQDLKILFMEEDIQETKKNLRIYTIRIANVGSVNILESHYDSQQQWGIQFSGAEIVQAPRVVDSNSDYLKEHIAPVAQDKSVIAFSKIILERGKYFTVETLVLHDKDTAPALTVLGKIAGIDDPQVVAIPQREVSFFGKAFYGNWLVQLARVVGYVCITILFFGAIIWLSEGISSMKKRRVRKRLAPFLDRLDEESRELVSRLLVKTDGELRVLKAFLAELPDGEAMRRNLAMAKEYFEMREEGIGSDLLIRTMPRTLPIDFFTKTGDGDVMVDESAVATLRDLIQYLESEEGGKRAKGSAVPSEGAPSDVQ